MRARGALVTAAGPQMYPVLHDLSLPTFERYGARWGFDVVAERLTHDGTGADDAARAAKWTKIRLLRAALDRYPVAAWLDADVLVLRNDDDLTAHLHPRAFQALVLEQVPAEHRVNPNTGVWVLRSGAEASRFLDAVEAAGMQPGPWADQGAVLAALGWERGDDRYRWARPGAGSPFLAGTSWLPVGWNQPYLDGRDPAPTQVPDSYADRPVVAHPHALHFMGMTPAARYRAMAAVLRDRERAVLPSPA